MSSTDEKSPKILLVAPQEAVDMLCPSLEKYGYKIEPHVEVSGGGSDEIGKLAKPDLCIISNFSGAKDYDCCAFLNGFKKRFSDVPILFLFCTDPTGQETKLSECGNEKIMSETEKTFFFPFEKEQILNEIFFRLPIDIPVKKLDLGAMMKIDTSDIDSEETFPFDIYLYLSLNKKIILYRRAGMKCEGKFKNKADNPRFLLLVKRSDYYAYEQKTVDKLKDIQESNLTEIQKNRMIKKETCALVQDLFTKESIDQEDGQKILDNFRNISSKFIESTSGTEGAQDKIKMMTAQILSQQTHSVNVSAYTALFGMIAGVKDLHDLSLAGLLHDVGFYKLPMNLAEKREWELSGPEKESYKMHPLYAVDVILDKKLPVSAKTQTIIQQHHERHDGSGYPHGIKGDAIDPLAKICGFADVFDELTSLYPGQESITPADALKKIAGLDGGTPHPVYDEKVHGPIVEALLEAPQPKEEAKEEKPKSRVADLMSGLDDDDDDDFLNAS